MLKTGKLILIAMALLSWAMMVKAEPSIVAKVSAHEVPMSGQITLSFEISGVENMGSFPALDIPGFQVQPAGQTRSVQWVNGVTSSMISINFLLTPTQIGSFTIPAITLSGGGKEISSQPLVIRVYADSTGSGASGNSAPTAPSIDVPSEGIRPVFITATVDRSKAVIGQQILLSVKFVRRPNIGLIGQPRYSEPEMTGFLVERMYQQDYSSNINGVPYQVTEIRYALFPTSDGDYAIGSARVDVQLQTEVDPFDPNSFFQNFFARPKPVQLTTRAIAIQVRSLPKNKPTFFSGAVGRYKIRSKVDSDSIEVGKPINLIVTIEGTGNIKALKEPLWPQFSSLKKYETLSSSKIDANGRFISGSKEFKVLLIPQVSGNIVIPPLSYIYFDPDLNDFVTTTSLPINLTVKPGTLAVDDPSSGAEALAPSGQAAQGVQVVEKGIRFLKSGKISRQGVPIIHQWPFIVLNAFPLLFIVGVVISLQQSKRRSHYAHYYQSKESVKKAFKTLKMADKNFARLNSTEFFGALYNSLSLYLFGRFDVSASDLVWDNLKTRLEEKGISESQIHDIKDIFDSADMARFGVSIFNDHERRQALIKTKNILSSLEAKK